MDGFNNPSSKDPEKGKKCFTSGRVSPRAMFANLKPPKFPKLEQNSNKSVQAWKPPVKKKETSNHLNLTDNFNNTTENIISVKFNENHSSEELNLAPSPNSSTGKESTNLVNNESYKCSNEDSLLNINSCSQDFCDFNKDLDSDSSVETVKNENISLKRVKNINILNDVNAYEFDDLSTSDQSSNKNLLNDEVVKHEEPVISDEKVLEINFSQNNATYKNQSENSTKSECLNAIEIDIKPSNETLNSSLLDKNSVCFFKNPNSVMTSEISNGRIDSNDQEIDFKESEDSFDLEVTNSQFLLIEKEAQSEITNRKYTIPNNYGIGMENTFDVSDVGLQQLNKQKDLLKQIIKDIDELNRTIVRAAMNLKNTK